MSATKQVQVRVPKMGMDTTEVVVAGWLVEPGQRVQAGNPLVELESEKVTFGVEAEVSGTLEQVLAPTGSTVAVGQVLCTVQADAIE